MTESKNFAERLHQFASQTGPYEDCQPTTTETAAMPRHVAEALRDAAQALFQARQRSKKSKCLYCGTESHITTRYHKGIGGGYWLCRWESCRQKDAATRRAFAQLEPQSK